MSDDGQRPTHPTTQPDNADMPEPRGGTKNVPALAWIIGALVVVAISWGAMQRGGTHVTPQGGETPMAKQEDAVMPAAPASGDAPATPAGAVTGPR